MFFFDCQKQASRFLDNLFERLIDPVRCERAIVILLAGYAAIWTLYGVVSQTNQDIHFDMGEMVAWSDQLLLGTPKHPPFGAWLVWAWFKVMPATDWSYCLLAVTVPTVALWFAWRIAGLYLVPEKRVFGIVLLTLVPFYNFHALKYNANTVMMPFWALTTWAFLRSLETQRAGWAALTRHRCSCGDAGEVLVNFSSIGTRHCRFQRFSAPPLFPFGCAAHYHRRWASSLDAASGLAGHAKRRVVRVCGRVQFANTRSGGLLCTTLFCRCFSLYRCAVVIYCRRRSSKRHCAP